MVLIALPMAGGEEHRAVHPHHSPSLHRWCGGEEHLGQQSHVGVSVGGPGPQPFAVCGQVRPAPYRHAPPEHHSHPGGLTLKHREPSEDAALLAGHPGGHPATLAMEEAQTVPEEVELGHGGPLLEVNL